MSPQPTKPSDTYALVVGIEQYDAGSDWNLSGPVQDSLRFTCWLLDRGVPRDQIILCLSPFPAHPPHTVPEIFPATQEQIKKVVSTWLPPKCGDTLIVFWGGHGAMSADNHQRLFYSNTTTSDYLNLDLQKLLTFLRSSRFMALHQQIVLVDACSIYYDQSRSEWKLPDDDFSEGKPRNGCEQFVLFATHPGEVAQNIDSERTGSFSRELLKYVESLPEDKWPPDMHTLAHELQTRFDTDCAKWPNSQGPVYYWWKDWDGNQMSRRQPYEQYIADRNAKMTSTATPSVRPLSIGQDIVEKLANDGMLQDELVNLLCACPTLRDQPGRSRIIRNLGTQIANAIDATPQRKNDISGIIAHCLSWPGKLDELMTLLRRSEPSAIPLQKVEDFFQELHALA